MLVGRDAELARIADLVAAARAGRSGALVLVGEPGIGKTTLCESAANLADQMQVLRVSGVASELELPFAALTLLFATAGDRIAALPPRQREAMESALGMRPPSGIDPFAVGVATLGLLAAVADGDPLLCIVDDLQWIDASSAEALAFAARRLQAEGVAMLFAGRPSDDQSELTAGLGCLSLSGLSFPEALTVLSAVAGAAIDVDVARALHSATSGNPLALTELPSQLSVGQLAGWEPLDDPLPPGPATDRAYRRRIADLDPDARTALVVVAASGDGELALVLGALADLGVDPAGLEAAEEANIVRSHRDHIEFRHPLLRAAAYHSVLAPARRRAHAAIAGVLDVDDARRAWHLGAAAIMPDSTIADALDAAGVDARLRGAHATAARALQRSAELTPDGDSRARRLTEAAADLNLIGRPSAAVVLASEALGHVRSPELRADIELVYSSFLTLVGRPLEAHRRLTETAASFESSEPGRAAILQMTAVGCCYLIGDGRLAYRTAEQAHVNALRVGGPLEVFADSVLAQTLVIRGETSRARELLERCLPFLMSVDPVWGPHLSMAQGVCISYMWIEQFATARQLVERIVSAARAASAPGLLPFPLSVLSELDLREGAWDQAYSSGHEALELAHETGQSVHLPRLLSGLARIEAHRGDEVGCRAHVAESLRLGVELGESRSAQMNADEVLGLLEFGNDRPEDALTHLDDLAAALIEEEVGEPWLMGAVPERIELLVRVGRSRDARNAIATFTRQADVTGSKWARAAAWRCEGVLASAETPGLSGTADRFFGLALEAHDQLVLPFERARTELCYGEALRRLGRRREARQQLQRAIETFAALGARPWLRRAEQELAATGQKARRRDPSTLSELTPQELRVALAVANGASNREAATALFLSTKTIEFHLGNIYRKLGVRSRSELARHYAVPGAGNRPDAGAIASEPG